MISAQAETLLREMVEIPSTSGNEQDLASYLTHASRHLGFRSYIDDAGNMIAQRGPTTAPMILLAGHMDTVPGMTGIRQEGPLLYGRGTVDAKGPLTTMLYAAAQADIGDAQIVVAGTVQEETTGCGAAYLARTHKPTVAIVGEPNGWSGVGIGYKGRVCLRYEVSRPARHTASLEQNATEAAVEFWNRVTTHLAAISPRWRVFDRAIATLYRISGTIEQASLEIWCRTPPGFALASFEEFLHEAARDGLVSIGDRTPGVRVSTESSTVRALCSSIRGQGGQPRLKLKSGTADLNVVSNYWSIPMAVYGPGDSSLDHTDHEHIDLREYATSIGVLTDTLNHLAVGLLEDTDRPTSGRSTDSEDPPALQAVPT